MFKTQINKIIKQILNNKTVKSLIKLVRMQKFVPFPPKYVLE